MLLSECKRCLDWRLGLEFQLPESSFSLPLTMLSLIQRNFLMKFFTSAVNNITLKIFVTLSCFTVRDSVRCYECWYPPPPLPPHHPHHHLSPPMSPQNSLHLIIAKGVSDADDQPLQNSPIIISQPPPLITWVERSKDLPIWKRVNNGIGIWDVLGAMWSSDDLNNHSLLQCSLQFDWTHL